VALKCSEIGTEGIAGVRHPGRKHKSWRFCQQKRKPTRLAPSVVVLIALGGAFNDTDGELCKELGDSPCGETKFRILFHVEKPTPVLIFDKTIPPIF